MESPPPLTAAPAVVIPPDEGETVPVNNDQLSLSSHSSSSTTPPDGRREPETTVSLDKEEEVLSDLEQSPKQEEDDEDKHVSVRAEPETGGGGESSSADDSSYFADPSHLPKPKSSSRRYSHSSAHSIHSQNKNRARESDASLSFSEDSEEDNRNQPRVQRPVSTYPQPMFGYPHNPNNYHPPPPPPGGAANSTGPYFTGLPRGGPVPELYPEQLTRMHSVSSLVSTTSSQNSSEDEVVKGGTAQNTRAGLTPSQLLAWSSSNDLVYSGDSQNNSHGDLFKTNPEQQQQQEWTPPPPPAKTMEHTTSEKGFKVYWQRWLMLMYMSVLNLLSDWTCYSVAPIAVLTEEAFGRINAEQLVVIFLGANAISTACEPIILSRLGLRRTVLFGALLLMIGSIVKSGGMPPIIQANLQKGQGEWRVYLGFFLVGLSQPLYQCTPALLSASWFPEEERTMATGVALNANQLGIGFAFVFGTLLVAKSDDIPKYFGLLSLISTLTFLGTLVQFDDAPPTPPSDTARVMRGTLEVKLPSVQTIFESVRNIGSGRMAEHDRKRSSKKSSSKNSGQSSGRRMRRNSRNGAEQVRGGRKKQSTRRRGNKPSPTPVVFPGPSPAQYGTVASAPSPMMPGKTPRKKDKSGEEKKPSSEEPQYPPQMLPYQDRREERGRPGEEPLQQQQYPPQMMPYPGMPGGYYVPGMPPPPDQQQYPGMNFPPPPDQQFHNPYGMYPPAYHQPPQFPPGFYDPRMAAPPFYQQQVPYPPQAPPHRHHASPPSDPYYQYYSYQGVPPPPHTRDYAPIDDLLPSAGAIDEGAEPVITITPHHVDINIRDDQIILSTRACLARPGFIHSLVSFTVSGIVINTLSTFMDYLVRLNGAGREYTGMVGGTFQCMIMVSSLIIGKVCDNTRAYYSITIGMLVVGAFGLAECGVSLDADRGSDMRWSLIVVAILVGPLQPISTELGVDVVYPLSENTVLVIQQLFSNLLSAAFIPCFKAMRDIGIVAVEDGATERPQYTFSFYLLIVLHATATVFFATFNGRYLRYEHELEKKAHADRKRLKSQGNRAFHRITKDPSSKNNEQSRLIP